MPCCASEPRISSGKSVSTVAAVQRGPPPLSITVSRIAAQRHAAVPVGQSPSCDSQRSCTNLGRLLLQSGLLLGGDTGVHPGHLPVSLEKRDACLLNLLGKRLSQGILAIDQIGKRQQWPPLFRCLDDAGRPRNGLGYLIGV